MQVCDQLNGLSFSIETIHTLLPDLGLPLEVRQIFSVTLVFVAKTIFFQEAVSRVRKPNTAVLGMDHDVVGRIVPRGSVLSLVHYEGVGEHFELWAVAQGCAGPMIVQTAPDDAPQPLLTDDDEARIQGVRGHAVGSWLGDVLILGFLGIDSSRLGGPHLRRCGVAPVGDPVNYCADGIGIVLIAFY